MSMERAGAIALFVGAVGYSLLMAVHPSHGGGHPIGPFSLSGIVHATALVLKPVILFGFYVFARRLGFDRPLVVLGLCFYLLASPFTMLAGTMSGVMFPYISAAAHAPGADINTMQDVARYTMWLNRSFAQVHYDIASIAILLWAIGWPAKSVLDWVGRVVGAAAALFVLGWQLSGTINFEARQGALWITLSHAVFMALAAASLLQKPKG